MDAFEASTDCDCCNMQFPSKFLLERHFQFSYKHAHKLRELEALYYTPEERHEEEVVHLVQQFFRKSRSKRALLCVPPKSLTMSERTSVDAIKKIQILARKRWLFAIHTVLKQQQVKLMSERWHSIDVKRHAMDGYCLPEHLFSGSRLFLRGEERMFIDIALYLHKTAPSDPPLSPSGRGSGAAAEKQRSVIEVVPHNFK